MHQRISSGLLLACVLCGCRSTYDPASAARYDGRRVEAEDWLFANVVNPQCDGRDSAPATMVTTPRGVWTSAHNQPCGLVVNEVQAPEYERDYVTKVCGGLADATCNDKYQHTFIARLAERYHAADFNAVSTRCTAHPVECGKMSTLELWVLESHNTAVRAEYDARQNDAANVYQQEQSTYAANALAANAATLQAVSDAFKPPPQINCTSTTYGTTTNTQCQ